MIRIRPKWFPQKTVKDLHARSAELLKILKEFNLNTYVMDLTSVLFLILKIKWFTSFDFSYTTHWLMSLTLSQFLRVLHFSTSRYSSYTAEKIDNILDDEFMVQLD